MSPTRSTPRISAASSATWFRCIGAVSQRFRKILNQLGSPDDRKLYILRHTHATELLRTGTHVKKVSARLGHASIKETLDTYSRVDVEMDHEVADTFAAAYPD